MTRRIAHLLPLSTLVAAATLALGGCSASEDTPVIGASSAALAASASAGPGARHRGPGRHHGPEQLVQRWDKNGDGKLQLSELPEHAQRRMAGADANGDQVITQEELVASRAKHRRERFSKADQNGDGKLTQDEVGEKRWQFMSKADQDGDGAVTREELKQAKGLRGPRGHHKFHRGKGHGKLQPGNQGPDGNWRGGKGRAGRNGDRRHSPGTRIFDRFDANKDGKLTESELPAPVWSHVSQADANQDHAVTQEELKQAHQDGRLGPPPGRRGGRGKRGSGPESR